MFETLNQEKLILNNNFDFLLDIQNNGGNNWEIVVWIGIFGSIIFTTLLTLNLIIGTRKLKFKTMQILSWIFFGFSILTLLMFFMGISYIDSLERTIYPSVQKLNNLDIFNSRVYLILDTNNNSSNYYLTQEIIDVNAPKIFDLIAMDNFEKITINNDNVKILSFFAINSKIQELKLLNHVSWLIFIFSCDLVYSIIIFTITLVRSKLVSETTTNVLLKFKTTKNNLIL